MLRIVNFACGARPGRGCINIDGSPTVLLARVPLPLRAYGPRANFVRLVRAHRVKFGLAKNLSFPQDSLDAFYSSHTLEHLSRAACESLLRRIRLWLKPSGVLRIVMPDLRRMAAAYSTGETDADSFVKNTYLATDSLKWWEIWFGHAYHRWMYDAESFRELLRTVGYQKIRECSINESRLSELKELDVPALAAESFYIEGEK